MPAFHSRRAMVLMLAPPTLWALHFLACYLIVSLACAHGAGQDVVRTGIALASVAGLAPIGLIAWRSLGQWRAARDLQEQDAVPFFAIVTLMLCALSALALFWVALPGFMLPPCVA
jgi:hypothetical protein